ncbi:MAG: DNA translocase FtsK, partial [Pseudomonadota bacterium]
MTVSTNVSKKQYLDCLRQAIRRQRCSASFFQKKCGMSFPRAKMVVHLFETAGLISPPDPKGRRQVLATEEAYEEIKADFEAEDIRDETTLTAPAPTKVAAPLLATYKPEPAYRRTMKRTPENVEEILHRVSEGEHITAVLKNSPHLPAKTQFFAWLSEDGELRMRYEAARQAGADLICRDIIDIADDKSQDFITTYHPGGASTQEFNAEHVQRSKLRVDARFKVLSRLYPEKFAERMILQHEGAIAGSSEFGPITTHLNLRALTASATEKFKAFFRQL